ncbi:hypothetical protein GA0070216_104372 [Micromonospora matsumotoense]|uniref:AMP-binding enzyme n=1 Tax=Micromonospora matsumotoense TaxID=121616 RepID=A0A1C4XGC4_9ACTN|nr:hypothetical protein [Micromonospora matsumotoense]SCF07588.1 hypothetical protein GA0070216_104372 [Micromonospora matsumotoense]
MRWLEELLSDGWWATGQAVRFQLPHQSESSITYGDLLRQAATLAGRIGEPGEGAQIRLAILTMGSAEGLVALLAGLIVGAVVISTPIQTTSPWSADLLGDPDVVLTDATGAAVLQCHERLIGARPRYQVLTVDLTEPAKASVRPDVCTDQDDVCKVAYLDQDRSPLVVALTGFALNAAVRQPDRRPVGAAGGLGSLTGQLASYRTLATGGVVDLVAPRRAGRSILDAAMPVTLPRRTERIPADSTATFPYIVDNTAQLDRLVSGIVLPAGSGALSSVAKL